MGFSGIWRLPVRILSGLSGELQMVLPRFNYPASLTRQPRDTVALVARTGRRPLALKTK
jgi:hypothetical protein